jgi:hypothetical protein
VLLIHVRLHKARLYDENKVSQRLVAIRAFISPALLEEIVKLFPLLELQNCL